jgi:ubiquitin C-terminal hydrolase
MDNKENNFDKRTKKNLNKDNDLNIYIDNSTSEGNDSNKAEKEFDLLNMYISNENSITFFGKKKKKLKFSSFGFCIPKNKIKLKKVKEIKFSLIPDEDSDIIEDEFEYLSEIKPKGLQNLGGCCYMNSTLQCFFHIKEFTDYFLKNKKTIKKKNGLISKGLLDTIEGLSKNDTKTYYSPIEFKNNLIEVDDSFQGSGGKDSADLVDIILCSCQDELGGDLEFPNTSLDQTNESLLFLDLYYKNNKVQSIVLDIFSFYLRIKNTCNECDIIYYDITTENMITFNLEQIFNFQKNNSESNSRFNKRIVSIEDCLEFYSFDNSTWENAECKYCHKKALTFSVKSFATLPKYLIFHMYRGKDEKFECNVDFNEHLDLGPSYYSINGIKNEENTKYTLCAGTILWGSNGYGHTVAFCKHFNEEYYIFNDSSAYRTNFKEIKNQKIYLLFYKKNN